MLTLYFATLLADSIESEQQRTEFAVSAKQAAFFAKQSGFDKFKIHKSVFTRADIVRAINS